MVRRKSLGDILAEPYLKERDEIGEIGKRAGENWASSEATEQQLHNLDLFFEDDILLTPFECHRCRATIKHEIGMAILESTNPQDGESFWDKHFGLPQADFDKAHGRIHFYEEFCRSAIDYYLSNDLGCE